jgi:hypothetical protein
MFKGIQLLVALGILVLLIVVGAGAYMTGRNAGLTEQVNIRTEFFQQRIGSQSTVPGGSAAATNDPAQATRNLQGRQLAAGTVKSVQGNVVQVTLRDDSTTSVTLNDKMSVTKTMTGTLADIQPGWTIVVFEATGSGGTQRIMLTQELGQGQGQGQGQRSGQGQGATPKPGQ